MPTKESRLRREAKLTGTHVYDNRNADMKVDKDAVDLLLQAFGYPTTAPLMDAAHVTKLHKENE